MRSQKLLIKIVVVILIIICGFLGGMICDKYWGYHEPLPQKREMRAPTRPQREHNRLDKEPHVTMRTTQETDSTIGLALL